MTNQVIRFGVGSAATPYVPVWRLWVSKSDVYIAQRDMAGTFKISLHEKDWVTQFTRESGVRINGVSRRHTKWEMPPPFTEGWVQGPTISVPAVEWAGEIGIKQDVSDSSNVEWFPVPSPNHRIDFTVLFSDSGQRPDDASVLRNGDMLEEESLSLTNGKTVWLYGREVVLSSDDQSHISWLENEFRGFTSSGTLEDLKGAAGIEVFKDQPLVIQFPLGLRHFTFG
jgi:hypothetical protein